MSCLKNLRPALSRQYRYCYNKSVVRPKAPPQESTNRHYHASSRRPGQVLQSIRRGLFRGDPVGCSRPPPPQAPLRRHYSKRLSDLIRFTTRSGGPEWYQDKRVVEAAYYVSGCAAIALCCGKFETVPYSDRMHFIVLPPSVERWLGEKVFARFKHKLASKILAPEHPDSIRVRKIAMEVVFAAHRLLAGGRHDDDECADDAFSPSYGDVAIKSYNTGPEVKLPPLDEEALDDRLVTERRYRQGMARPHTRHLDGLKWEVVVVQDKLVNAMCVPGGKILVSTGLLDSLETDAEVATVLGHEIAHVVARHGAEKLTKDFGYLILKFVMLLFIEIEQDDLQEEDLVDKTWKLFFQNLFSRRMEMEADHIGIMLLAAAGFDARIAPTIYEKLGKITGDSALQNYISTHPSSKKRSHILSQDKVMQEAMELYREAKANKEAKEAEDFFSCYFEGSRTIPFDTN